MFGEDDSDLSLMMEAFAEAWVVSNPMYTFMSDDVEVDELLGGEEEGEEEGEANEEANVKAGAEEEEEKEKDKNKTTSTTMTLDDGEKMNSN